MDLEVTPENVKTEFSGDKAVYTMTVKDDGNHIDAVITAELTVEGSDLKLISQRSRIIWRARRQKTSTARRWRPIPCRLSLFPTTA